VQIAKDFLQMGKLLGLSVIHNEKAEISRITGTLRKNKKGPADQGNKGPPKQ